MFVVYNTIVLTLGAHALQGYSSWVCVCPVQFFHTVMNDMQSKRAFFIKQPLRIATYICINPRRTCQPFCLPSLVHKRIFNLVTLHSTTWYCSWQFCHCVCAALYSARVYLTGCWSRAACGVHYLKEGIYVLSAVFHVPEEGSWGFSTLVLSYRIISTKIESTLF